MTIHCLYQIHNASPEALAKIPAFDIEKADMTPEPIEITKRTVYPFKRMKVGHCFIVGFESDDRLTLSNQSQRLRSKASHAGTKLQRKFAVLRHNDHKVFEIVRIA